MYVQVICVDEEYVVPNSAAVSISSWYTLCLCIYRGSFDQEQDYTMPSVTE
jgi:hypothetical protein